jgi:Ser/Thr protein kinase RdoA (MazF antagonist)
VCGPIPNKDGKYVVVEGDLIVVASTYARGTPVDYFNKRWKSDRDLIFAWGRWFAQLHQASRKFYETHPEIAKGV